MICGSLLVSVIAHTQTVQAQQRTSKINPCPSIFYEEPHNNQVLVPTGCTPNAFTRRQVGQGGSVVVQPRILVQPQGLPVNRQPIPYPESRQNPIAVVAPAGTVNVRLKNNTNASITYQAIGHTKPRTLSGREEYLLQNLPTPVTITVVRSDGGLLRVVPTSSEGMLAVSLDETTNFDDNQGVLRIQKDGQVFLN
ncbi:hypothetical protein NIES4071_08020 [Calothrix sp. NIES-4071]|nr:hypothetical protein NIES4071_08020 [Calothrix sp. NIES-4071]BAZ55144.1 hypothetical protein NIES4105_07980 [Calothrix sp. NIES-4105]